MNGIKKKETTITVGDEEKCVKECYCSVRNISKMNIIIALISVRCILGRCIELSDDDVFDVWQVYICVYLAFFLVKQKDEVLAFSLKLSVISNLYFYMYLS